MYFLDRIHLEVVRYRYFWLTLSVLVLVGGLVALFVRGLNLGVDFTGGTIVQRAFTRPVTVAQVREALTREPLASLQLQKSSVQSAAGNIIILRSRPLTVEEEQRLDAGLEQLIGPLDRNRSSTDTVGPVIGKELYTNAIKAVALASFLILVYVSFRFEFKFGVAAVIALLHDVFLTLGLAALIGYQVNTPFIAAILTVVGYSINDTIVIFDRIRENLRLRKKESYAELVDKSINQTLSRSINTVGTTLVSIIALFFLGGVTLREFTLPLIIGITSGAYSSIFVAPPLWVIWKEVEQKGRAPAVRTGR